MAFAICGSVLAVAIALSAADASVNRPPRDECLPGNRSNTWSGKERRSSRQRTFSFVVTIVTMVVNRGCTPASMWLALMCLFFFSLQCYNHLDPCNNPPLLSQQLCFPPSFPSPTLQRLRIKQRKRGRYVVPLLSATIASGSILSRGMTSSATLATL